MHNLRQKISEQAVERSQFGVLMRRRPNTETWLNIASMPFASPDNPASRMTAPIFNLFVTGRVNQSAIKGIINRHLDKCHKPPVYYQIAVKEDEHLIRRYTSQTGRTEDLSLASVQNRDPGLVRVGVLGNSLIRIYVGFHEEHLEYGIIGLLSAIARDVETQVEMRLGELLRV